MNNYKPEGTLISTQENHDLISSERGLIRALERQIILEAPAILCDQELNLHVALGDNMRGIIPKCEVQHSAREDQKDIAISFTVCKE